MSRGPGRVSRTIAAAFKAEPDNAFTTDDLCLLVYPGINRVEKKHRVAVLRAARRVLEPHMHAWWAGKQVIFYNPYSLGSYRMTDVKNDCRYRHGDRQQAARLSDLYDKTRSKLVDSVQRDKVAKWIAQRDGDTATVAEKTARLDEAFAVIRRARLITA